MNDIYINEKLIGSGYYQDISSYARGAHYYFDIGSIDAFPVAFLVFAIGLSLGGTTGYAINPARDLGPRIMHSLLPISKKRDSDWSYSWIPIVGPLIGATLASGLYMILC